MSFTCKVANRQIVTLNADLDVPTPPDTSSVNQQIYLNLRFVPDVAVIRQLSYSGTNDTPPYFAVQIYLDLAIDLLVASIPLGPAFSVAPQTTFIPKSGFQSGNVNMQIQMVPNSGSGMGNLITPNANYGFINMVLEFIQFDKK